MGVICALATTSWRIRSLSECNGEYERGNNRNLRHTIDGLSNFEKDSIDVHCDVSETENNATHFIAPQLS